MLVYLVFYIFESKMIEFFSKGLILGFAIAAPVGPIGIHCIRKTLHFGKASGFCAGLGAALADTFYGCISVFSLTIVSQYLLEWKLLFKLIGGIFLLYLGWSSFRSVPAMHDSQTRKSSLVKDFVETFFLTLLNPLTLLAFLGGFAVLGLVETEGDLGIASVIVFGVFCGASFWWLILSEGVGRLRKKIGNKALHRINQIAGILIGALGIWSLTTLLIA